MRYVGVCKPSVSVGRSPGFHQLKLINVAFSVMLNDHTLYQHILDDDLFLGVVGMLECQSSPFLYLNSAHIPINDNLFLS